MVFFLKTSVPQDTEVSKQVDKSQIGVADATKTETPEIKVHEKDDTTNKENTQTQDILISQPENESGDFEESTGQGNVVEEDAAKGPPAQTGNLKIGEYEVDYDADVTSLYKAIEMKEWDSVIEFLEDPTGPREAASWIYRKEEDDSLRWRILPLHAAVIFKAPERVIEKMLQIYPEAGMGKDDQGMTPLHLAFKHEASDETLYQLLDHCPKAISVLDNKGRIPIKLKKSVLTLDTSEKSPLPSFRVFHPLTPSQGTNLEKKTRPTSFAKYVSLALEVERQMTEKELKEQFNTRLQEVQVTHNKTLSELKQKGAEKLAVTEQKAAEELAAANDRTDKVKDEIGRVRLASQTLMTQFNLKCEDEEKLKKKSLETEKRLGEVIEAKDKELKAKNELNTRLKEQNGILEHLSEEFKTKMDSLERENSTLIDQLKRLEEALTSTKNENTRLREFKANAQELEEAKNSYKLELAASLDKIIEQESTITTAKAASEKLIKQYNAKAASELQLKQEIAKLKEDTNDKDEKIAMLKMFPDKVAQLEKVLSSYRTAVESLKDGKSIGNCAGSEKEHGISYLRILGTRLSELENANVSYQLKVSDLRSSSDAKQAENAMLQEKYSVMQRVSSELQEKLNKVETDLKSSKDDLNSRNEQVDHIKVECLALRATCKDLLDKKSELESEVSRLKSNTQGLSAKLRNMSREQESIIHAAMQNEQEIKSSLQTRISLMKKMNKQAEHERILHSAMKQKSAIESLLATSHRSPETDVSRVSFPADVERARLLGFSREQKNAINANFSHRFLDDAWKEKKAEDSMLSTTVDANRADRILEDAWKQKKALESLFTPSSSATSSSASLESDKEELTRKYNEIFGK